MNLVWFRNDLRLADHPALTHATKNNENVLALYIFNPKQHQVHGESPQKYEFIKSHVKDLRKRLKKINIELLVKSVPTFNDVPAVLATVVEQFDINAVYFNRSYWLNEIQRDKAVIKQLQNSEIEVRQYHANYLLPPGTVTKDNGEMYHVFTPYKNKYIERVKADYELPLSIPGELTDNKDLSAQVESESILLEAINLDDHLSQLWPIGEAAANERLKAFVADNDYDDERDYPAISGTSGLSPYFALGVLSAKQGLAHALKQHNEKAFSSTWVSELVWRDFYNDLLTTYPQLAKHQTFKSDAVDEWRDDDELFEQWQQGKTGFPIVDAGMRQLKQEGWMHNRVRMIVASFLTKLCLIDWRKGEAHFMAHLLDGDLASNNGGWQWSSATGCDAAPYFRIFNPTTQSKKFDPDGTYIKTYVKELVDVDVKKIHDPDKSTRDECGYPQPAIDYKQARTNALDWFKARK
ncbi:deoxyribodipyrimidine photo-lyase [Marinicella sp. S1101]|uniref:cryptochrome/photolyase family protein n=1 Tax=Marinicella marina TaxID=2996016 RepID=UPI002260A14A|nr:FAD-binding domain-containing protein [Marinicella marina]MCX7555051.1 deoxyribodipyrimidine photo-lyase [Marinicella marina]MDJ1141359.1 FAD-binding domain-containing protein [Marinicella marina]